MSGVVCLNRSETLPSDARSSASAQTQSVFGRDSFVFVGLTTSNLSAACGAAAPRDARAEMSSRPQIVWPETQLRGENNGCLFSGGCRHVAEFVKKNYHGSVTRKIEPIFRSGYGANTAGQARR